jgi:hypothetical protein
MSVYSFFASFLKSQPCRNVPFEHFVLMFEYVHMINNQ